MAGLSPTIRAIETRYAGCHFRSRLEARWAVFFDHLNIKWEYEPQGFQIFGDHYYLPDFYLPDTGTWVEVKGTFGPTELATIVNAVDFGGALPGITDGTGTARGLLLLGPLPRHRSHEVPRHSLFVHHKGVERELVYFHPWLGVTNTLDTTPPSSRDAWTASGFTTEDVHPRHAEQILTPTPVLGGGLNELGRALQRAYTAARSARFEHGQNGTTR